MKKFLRYTARHFITSRWLLPYQFDLYGKSRPLYLDELEVKKK